MAETRAPSLIARTIDYILGRNTLIGIASFMLLIISGYATWHGMRDFIVGVSSTHDQPGADPAGRHVVLNRSAGHRRGRGADVPDVADAARDVRRRPALARAADHLPALCVPRHLVDRLRLRLLVEPDRGRGGDAHGPRRPAGGCARRQRRHRRPPRRGERPARQRRHLVRRPDVARGDERRQLRPAVGCGPRSALQCAPQRARFHHHPARRHDPVVARAGAGRRRSAQAGGRRPRRRHGGGTPAQLRGPGLRHPRPRAQHRRAQQPARQVDGRRDARAGECGERRAGQERASPATIRRSPNASRWPPRRPSSRPS